MGVVNNEWKSICQPLHSLRFLFIFRLAKEKPSSSCCLLRCYFLLWLFYERARRGSPSCHKYTYWHCIAVQHSLCYFYSPISRPLYKSHVWLWIKVWWSFFFCACVHPVISFWLFPHPEDQKDTSFIFYSSCTKKKNDMGPKRIWTSSCLRWVAAPGPLGTRLYVKKTSVWKARRMNVVPVNIFLCHFSFLHPLFCLFFFFALIFVILLIGSIRRHGSKQNSETLRLLVNSRWYLSDVCFFLLLFFHSPAFFFFSFYFVCSLQGRCHSLLKSQFCFLRSRTQNNLFCHSLWAWERAVKDATFSVACYWKTLVVNTDATYPDIHYCLLLIQVSMQVIFDLLLPLLLRRRCLDFSVSKTQVCRFKAGHFDRSIAFDYTRLCSASSTPACLVSLVVS